MWKALKKVKYAHLGRIICVGILLLINNLALKAQSVSVNRLQDLSFGAFIQGSGGTVTVSHNGTRTSTGDIILANLGVLYFPATIEITGAPNGTNVSILTEPRVSLSGSKGGSIELEVGASDKGSSFITSGTAPTTVSIGGKLTIGNQQNNPAGNYTGSFSVTFTFIYE